MALHICLNGKNHQLNNRIIEHLKLFYTNKQYKLITLQDQVNTNITHILSNGNTTIPEQLLLRAFNRSYSKTTKTYHEYQIILWNGSVIDDYQLIQGTKIPSSYVTKLNRYNPKHDLYITIGEPAKNIPKSYNHYNITDTSNTDKLFEEIVKTIFDNLPRCNWCGKLFKPTKKNYKYCSKKCSRYGWEENNRKNNREYYKRNKDTMSEKQRNGLGSKNAYLGAKPETNPLVEMEKVRKAKRSLGLKSIQDL